MPKKKHLKPVVFLIVLLIASLFAELLIERKPYFFLDGFGFFAWYGFAGCAVLILLAKLLGFFIRRGDRYYKDD